MDNKKDLTREFLSFTESEILASNIKSVQRSMEPRSFGLGGTIFATIFAGIGIMLLGLVLFELIF